MPIAKCQLNLTLEVPVAEKVESLGRNSYQPPSRIGRVLLEQRLRLEKAGWRIGDKEMLEILKMVCSLDEKGMKKLRKHLETKTDALDASKSSLEGLVKDSFFASDRFPFR
jgi:hypothetical protein